MFKPQKHLINFYPLIINYSTIKFYPEHNTFTFLHDFNNFKYGNVHFWLFLGEHEFDMSMEKDFYLRLTSDMIESFFDSESDCYRFPFKIFYQVGHYNDDVDAENEVEQAEELEENVDESKFYEASETDEFVVVQATENNDMVEEGSKKLKQFYDDNHLDLENDSAEDSFRPFESVQAENDGESVEIIDESSKTSEKPSNQSTGFDFDHCECDKSATIIASPTEQHIEDLPDNSRSVAVSLLKDLCGKEDIIINHFMSFSDDEKLFIAAKLFNQTTLDNFSTVLVCADYWHYASLIETVVQEFIMKQECAILLQSKEWANLKKFESLYKNVVELVLARSIKNVNNSLFTSSTAFFLTVQQIK